MEFAPRNVQTTKSTTQNQETATVSLALEESRESVKSVQPELPQEPMETVALVDLTNNWSMANASALPDSFQTNLKSVPNAVMFLEPSYLTEPAQFAQENSLTTVKDVAALLDSPKSEPSANKLARMTNLLMTAESATDAQLTKSSQTEDVHALPVTSETTALGPVNFHAQLLNSDIKEGVPNVH
jgi:hypothetical protein